MIYIFDTNAISDVIKKNPIVVARLREHQQEHVLCLCAPIHYEVRRGLLWTNAPLKRRRYEDQFVPALEWVDLTDTDWEQAAQFWAAARRKGKQLADADLLLVVQLNAIIVSADDDFDALPVKREDWRE
jgi:tRNA(fMet)-specific endonuclease VapC